MKTIYIEYLKVISISKTCTADRLHRHVVISMSGQCWTVLRQRTGKDRWKLGEVVSVELVPVDEVAATFELEPFVDEPPDLDVEIEPLVSDAGDSGMQLCWNGVDATSPVRVEVPDRFACSQKHWGEEVAKRFAI